MRSLGAVWRLTAALLAALPRGKRRLVIAIVLATAASASSVALMGTSAWLLSRAAEMPPVLYLLVAATGVRFFGIGRGVFRYLERLVGHDIALRMQSALRGESYDALSKTTLLGSRHGDLLSRVTADVEAIVDIVVRVAIPFCSAGFVVLGASAILAIFSPLYAIVLLLTCVLAGVIVPHCAARLSYHADQMAIPARGDLADEVRELSRCRDDLLAYGLDREAIVQMEAVDERLRAIDSRGAWTRGLAAAVQTFSAGAAVCAGLWIGALAIAQGDLLTRELAVLVLTPMALHEVFADFTKAAQTLTRARTSLGRVLDILEADPIGSGERNEGQLADHGSLKIADLELAWPGHEPIARGITFEIHPSESVAIIGPSGLGKTTLAATIMGLIPPFEGRLDAPARIGYLAQGAHIFATSLAENVRIGNKDASDAEIIEAMRRAGLDLDAQRVVGEGGATLSGGEVQRVALARLLVAREPYDLVILDEPSEHLDRPTADRLLDDLFSLMDDTCLMVITHDESLMARCDRVIDLSQWAVSTTMR